MNEKKHFDEVTAEMMHNLKAFNYEVVTDNCKNTIPADWTQEHLEQLSHFSCVIR